MTDTPELSRLVEMHLAANTSASSNVLVRLLHESLEAIGWAADYSARSLDDSVLARPGSAARDRQDWYRHGRASAYTHAARCVEETIVRILAEHCGFPTDDPADDDEPGAETRDLADQPIPDVGGWLPEPVLRHAVGGAYSIDPRYADPYGRMVLAHACYALQRAGLLKEPT